MIEEFFRELYPSNGKNELRSPEEMKHERLVLKQKVHKFLASTLKKYGIEVLDAQLLVGQKPTKKSKYQKEIVSRKFPEADLIFVQKNQSTDIQLAPIALRGFQAPQRKNSLPTELTPYNGVCGIVIVDDETPLSERKKTMRNAGAQLRQFNQAVRLPTTAQPTVLTVDSRLFESWKDVGPLATSEEISQVIEKKDMKKLAD